MNPNEKNEPVVTVNDLLLKIGSLTVELDLARGQIQQLIAQLDDGAEKLRDSSVDTGGQV